MEHDIFGTEPRKKGINSKRKGDVNERNLARILTKWTSYKFERVPSSGGLGWSNSVQTVGDVVCTEPNVRVPFTFETKALKNLGLSSPILRSNSCIFKHWYQCDREGKQANRIPLFIARDNGMKKYTWWVFMNHSIWYKLFEGNLILPQYFKGFQADSNFLLVGVSSEDFFKLNYKEVCNILS
jgi:hypothetical protein